MNITREQRRALERDNRKQTLTLRSVPRDMWPIDGASDRLNVMRSRDFLVQIVRAPPPARVRLTVNRTSVVALDGGWRDGISWDELQRVKREAGYAECDAVEIYPADADVVNDANMRHLWIMDAPLPMTWRARRDCVAA